MDTNCFLHAPGLDCRAMQTREPNSETDVEGGPTDAGTAFRRRMIYVYILWPAALAVVMAVAVGIFGVRSAEEVDPEVLVASLRTTDERQRTQAAFILAKYLKRRPGDDDATYRERLEGAYVITPEVLTRFENPTEAVEVRRYLALILGRIGDPRALPALRRALAQSDEDLLLNTLLALAQHRDAEATADVVRLSRLGAPEVRRVAIYTLTLLGTTEALARLEEALGDEAVLVRRQAALGLARHGNTAGEGIIAEILASGEEAARGEGRVREELFDAIHAAGALRTALLRDRLAQIAGSDQDSDAGALAQGLLQVR